MANDKYFQTMGTFLIALLDVALSADVGRRTLCRAVFSSCVAGFATMRGINSSGYSNSPLLRLALSEFAVGGGNDELAVPGGSKRYGYTAGGWA